MSYWSAQTRRYDRVALCLNRRLPDAADAAAEAAAGAERVLEIAAGTGLVSRALIRSVGHLVATDPSPAMREALRQRLAPHDNATVSDADATALPFSDGVFDAVVISNLLHLLPEPATALQEARRVLRRGGILVAPTYCHGEGGLARATSALLASGGFPIVTRFQGDTLDELIASEGFIVQDARWFSGLLPIRFVSATA